jgi:hypothetical protein
VGGERGLPQKNWLGTRWAKHANVVCVLGYEPLEIVRVIGLELTLDRECCVHKVTSDLFIDCDGR